MKKLSFLLIALTTVLYLPTAFAKAKPNIVYILVDNWGVG